VAVVTDGPVVGVLLAGGLGRRMGGGDKPLNMLGGKPILDYAIDKAKPQVDTLVLNANGDAARFSHYGLMIAADVIEGYAGPLAGILTGMEWALDNVPDSCWLVSFATDAPFFPEDMVERLMAECEQSDARIACARSHDRDHPVFALWSMELAADLRRAMVDEDMRKIDRWTARYSVISVEFQDVNGIDPFFNINRPDDLASAERLIKTPE
jgi:molybdenum cofactor guanylyltransferase